MKPLEIYIKLFKYLEKVYFDMKVDDLGLLLGDMRILDDEKSADPAILNDWISICNVETNDENIIFEKCISFLKQYSKSINSNEMYNLIISIEKEKQFFINQIIK